MRSTSNKNFNAKLPYWVTVPLISNAQLSQAFTFLKYISLKIRFFVAVRVIIEQYDKEGFQQHYDHQILTDGDCLICMLDGRIFIMRTLQ